MYGASTKGNTILQWCKIDNELVEYAAERNPDKYGASTLGTNIPIISEAESRAMNPDYYLVLPWHFKDEFLEREKEALEKGTGFIFPVPKVEVYKNKHGEQDCFICHSYPRQCGVYEFGKNVFNGISTSQKYNFIKAECDSLDELNVAIKKHNPAAIIYNYHPSVLPWLCAKISKGIYRNNLVDIKAVQIGIIHEITQQVADTATSYGNKFILGPSQKIKFSF